MAYEANVFPTFIVAEFSPQTQAAFSRYERAAAQSGERARRAFRQGEEGAAGVARQLRLAAAGAGAFQGALNGVSSRLNAIAGIFNQAGFGAGIATALSAAAAGFVTTGAKVQQYQQLLRAATGSEAAFQAAQEATARIAKDTRSSLDDTIRSYARLAVTAGDVGLAGADLERVLTTVQKAMQLSGAGTQEAAAAMQQFSQAIGSGKLAGDELRSILENAPKLGQYIAQGLNAQGLVDGVQVTIGNMRDLAAEGQITADKVVKALLYMSNTADTDFAQMGVTIGQATTQVRNALTQLVIGIEDTFGVLSGAAKVISALADNMNVLGVAVVALGARFIFTTAIAGLRSFALANTAAVASAMMLVRIAPLMGTVTVAMGALGAAAKGVMAMFGGPVGFALTAAATAVAYLATREDEAERATRKFAEAQGDLARWVDLATGAIKEQNRALLAQERVKQERTVTDSTEDFNAARRRLLGRAKDLFGPTKQVGSGFEAVDVKVARDPLEQTAFAAVQDAMRTNRYGDLAQTLQRLGNTTGGSVKPDLKARTQELIDLAGAITTYAQTAERARSKVKLFDGDATPEDLRRAQGDFSGRPSAVAQTAGAIGDGRSVSQIKADAELAASYFGTAQKQIQATYNKALKDIDAKFLDKGKLKDPKLAGEYEAALTKAAADRNKALVDLSEQKAMARDTARELRLAATEANQLGDAVERALQRNDSEPSFIDRIQHDIATLEEARRRLEASGKDSITLGDKTFSRDQIKQGIADAEEAKLKPIREATREMEDQLAVGKLILQGREDDAELLAADLATLRQYGIEQGKVPPEVQRELDGRRKVAALLIQQQRAIREAADARDTRQQIDELMLVIAGREDEAAVQRRIYSITQGLYKLGDDRIAQIRQETALVHDLSREYDLQRQVIAAQVDAARQVQDTLRNTLRGFLDGKFGASLKSGLKDLFSGFKDLEANQLSIKLFGDLGADVEDALTRASGPMGKASVEFKNATQTFAGAVNAFANATGNQPSVAQLTTTPSAYGAGSGGTAGALGSIGALIGGKVGGTLGTIAALGSMFGGGRKRDPIEQSIDKVLGAVTGVSDSSGASDLTPTTSRITQGTVDFIDAGDEQARAAKSFGMSVEKYKRTIEAAKQGDPEALYNLNFGKIGATIDKELGTKFAGKLGSQVGTLMQSAQIGQLAASITDPLAKALGAKTSKLGSQIGGAIGGAVAGPLGAAVGGAIGSVVGGAFKSTKKASGTISFAGGEATLGDIRGNTGKYDEAIGSAGDAITDSLSRIASELGGSLTSIQGIAIGIRHGDYRVDPTGTGKTKKKNGAIDFDDDAEAAVRYAIKLALERGVIGGIRDATQRLLTASGDWETQLQKALKFEDVFKQLEQRKDPIGYAIKELDKEFGELRRIFGEAAATSEEYAQLEELYQLKRQEILDKAQGAVANLVEMLADVARQIDEIENPTKAALTDITKKFDELKASLTKAGASAADLAQAEKLFALQRDQLKEQAGVADLDGQIKAILDPMGYALDQLDERFAGMRQALETLGGTAEEFAKLDQLYALQRAEAIKDATKQTISALQGFLDSLKTSESSGLSLSTRRTNAIAAFTPLAAQVASGQAVDEDAFIKAAQTLLEIEREMFGSTKGYFDRLTQITALTEKALGVGGTTTTSTAANDNATRAALLAAQAAAQVANDPSGTQISGVTAPPNATTAAALATQQATTAMTQALRATFTPQPSAPVFDVRPVVNAIGEQTRQLGQRLDRLIEQQDNALALANRKPAPASPLSGPRPGGVVAPSGRF